ncbi:uncharacterized protein AKAME5_000277700 [Lates japonicus]|uniref:Uncharacterized protein n=1 Tax=Lates japonicus TaxID=270547 RepID=A0AAD3M725_LATJO|nr:uncharacterized protein AKAME5_000277700 [Lates japonicus]
MAQKSPTLLTCQTPSPSLCVTLHRRTNYQTNVMIRMSPSESPPPPPPTPRHTHPMRHPPPTIPAPPSSLLVCGLDDAMTIDVIPSPMPESPAVTPFIPALLPLAASRLLGRTGSAQTPDPSPE